jgi:hypothetical protein
MFEEGVLLYYQRQMQKAAQTFKVVLEMNPRDTVAQLYLRRCQSDK